MPPEFDYSKNVYPLINQELLESLRLNPNPLIKLKLKRSSFYVFDETRNPTFSFKDRASILIAMKALQLGLTDISTASTGNAGSSIAGICARFGLRSNIFVPKAIPEAKRIQIQSYGARLFVVDWSYDEAFDLCLRVSQKKKWFNRNTALNPLTIEGKKSAAYDIYIAFKGNIPENIFIPVGDGVIKVGIYKGFLELFDMGLIEKLPRLIGVQSIGSNAVVRFLKNGEFNFQPAHTIADSICAAAPRNLFMAVEAIKNSRGFAIEISDDEILLAQQKIIQQFGIFVEPSSASILAGFEKSLEGGIVSDSEINLLLFTGNGLKDLNALKFWNREPQIKSYQEWLNEFEKEL